MRHPAVIWELQAQHLDEAELMLGATLRALDSPLFSIAEVADGPERRLLAHVDALIVGGPEVANRLLAPVLVEDREPTRVGAAALAVLYADDELGHQRLLASLDREQLAPPQRLGLVLGVARCVRSGIIEWLATGLERVPVPGLVGRLESFMAHRVDMAVRLPALLEREDPELLRAAAWLVRCCSDKSATTALPRLMMHSDVEVCRAAVESALILGHPLAWSRTLELAHTDGPLRRDALMWLALLGDSGQHARLVAMLRSEPRRDQLLWALGFCGRQAAVDATIEWLADDQLGAIAAEVVCSIAGLSPLAEGDAESCWMDRASAPEPPDFEHDDLDATLEPTGDELLPRPNPDAIAAWWHAHRGRFERSGRYLLGLGHGLAGFTRALEFGTTRRRQPLALELAVRSRGRILLDPLALRAVQRRQLVGLEQAPVNWSLALGGEPGWA